MHALKALFRFLGSFHLSVAIFGLLTLITWIGTLAQENLGLYQSQRIYFESWFVTREVEGITIPLLPGGLLLMTALFVNLVVGGVLQFLPRVLARSRGRPLGSRLLSGAGIAITHLGILALLLSCFAKYVLADEGGLQLREGESAAEFVSYHDWEVVIAELVDDGPNREFVVPHTAFADRIGDLKTTVRAAELPFQLILSGFAPNADVRAALPRAPAGARVAEGVYLQAIAPHKEWERNAAGCYARAEAPNGTQLTEGVLWALTGLPMAVTADGRSFAVSMRRRRTPMPFELRLDRFTHEYHPNSRIPRTFMSDVTVVDDRGADTQRIRMNEPLRRAGMIVFQSSWGPRNAAPGAELFSGFSVVRNPADQWPWYALYVIAVGMTLHFVAQLGRFLVAQAAEMRGRAG